MFIVEAIVLKVAFVREGECLCVVLSRDFGRISLWTRFSKTAQPFGTGSIVVFTLKNHNQINRSRGHYTRMALHSAWLSYRALYGFLSMSAYMARTLPEGVPFSELYDEYVGLFPLFRANDTCERASRLFVAKLAHALGIFALPEQAPLMLRRLVSGLERVSLPALASARDWSDDLSRSLDTAVERSFASYLG